MEKASHGQNPIRVLTAVLLVVGFLCTLALCGIRMGMEARNTDVCVVMSTDDMALLDGPLDGVRPFDGGSTLDGALLLVEDENQYSHNPITENYLPDALGPDRQLRQVRCFYLYPQFAARYGYLGYEGAEELENILYRAVTDRNIRVIWLTPFTDAETGAVVTNAAVYNQVLDNLGTRIARHGMTLGDRFSVFPAYDPWTGGWTTTVLLFGLFLFIALITGLFVYKLFPNKIAAGLLGFAVFAVMALALKSRLIFQAAALGTSILFPCISLWYMSTHLARLEGGTLGRELGVYLKVLGIAFGISILGGLCVGALQSSTEFLLANENFRGVKVSQLVPVAFGVFAVLFWLCRPKEILESKRSVIVLAVLLLAAGIAYYILRTGNASVGVLEQRARNFLEHGLITRPRTKEFLAAWPCVGIAAALIFRGKRHLSWPFAILSSVGFASVVNTFCHSRAPLWLSLTRSVLGLIIGAALGCIVVCLLHKRRAE